MLVKRNTGGDTWGRPGPLASQEGGLCRVGEGLAVDVGFSWEMSKESFSG